MADISTALPIPPTNDVPTEQDITIETQDTQDIQDTSLDDDFAFEELDEELIIEDFTIDGICGVY